MRNSLLIILILCFSKTLFAQNAEVTGRIVDDASGDALVGVIVFVDSTTGTGTDVNGNYSLSLLPGNYRITVKMLSFETDSQNFSVTAGEKKEINFRLKNSGKELNTVVISAGKFEQKLEEVTVSMEVLKPAAIENRNVVNMEEAMDFIPGVTVVDGQANIRGGSGWSYGAGSRVQLLVDDLPQLTADANDTKWNFLPIENLEQIEVIKGASSVLFGSSALNGVINVRTAYPKSKPLTKFSFFTGIYDRPVFKIDGKEYDLKWWGDKILRTSGFSFFHSQQAGNLDLVVGENVFDDQGYRNGENERRGRFNVNTRYRFKKIDGLSAGINMNTMAAVNTLFFLFRNDTSGAYTPAPNTLSNSRTYRTNVDPFITYATKKSGTFRFRSRWFNTTNENNRNQDSKAILFYSELQYQKTIKEDFNLTGGIVNINSSVESELYGDHSGDQQAAYIQGDLKYKRFSFSAGARAERNNADGIQENWIPVVRAGLNYNPLKGTYVRTSVGQGYRFPSIAERFIKTNVGGIVVYPNINLQSEKGLSMEIGVRQLFSIKKWYGYIDAAVFRNEYENMMEFAFAQWGLPGDPVNGIGFKSLNIGNTRIDGFEGSVFIEGKMGKDWKINLLGGYTFIDPRLQSFDSTYLVKVGGIGTILGSDSTTFLKYRFEHTLKADLNISWKQFEAGLSYRYTSRMVNVDKIFAMPLSPFDFIFAPGLGIGHYRKYHRNGDAIFDLRTAWNVSGHIKLSFIVKNLTNYIYMQRPADMQPPRMFIGQVNFTF